MTNINQSTNDTKYHEPHKFRDFEIKSNDGISFYVSKDVLNFSGETFKTFFEQYPDAIEYYEPDVDSNVMNFVINCIYKTESLITLNDNNIIATFLLLNKYNCREDLRTHIMDKYIASGNITENKLDLVIKYGSDTILNKMSQQYMKSDNNFEMVNVSEVFLAACLNVKPMLNSISLYWNKVLKYADDSTRQEFFLKYDQEFQQVKSTGITFPPGQNVQAPMYSQSHPNVIGWGKMNGSNKGFGPNKGFGYNFGSNGFGSNGFGSKSNGAF